MKTIGIMQPYFLPYIGYFQLINMVDEFVIYDNIEFTKKGWVHRNRMLQNGKDVYFTLPIRKDSDFLDVDERFLADSFEQEKLKILRRIESNYRKAPFFHEFYPVIEEIFDFPETNLFQFVLNSVQTINTYLGIKTPLILSSTLGEYIRPLRSQNKVIAICKEMEASHSINPSGGIALYDKSDFAVENIKLNFYRIKPISYPQFKNEFVPDLSILDVGMFNDVDRIRFFLTEYELL